MRRFDVFNGDADGICALRQLRLAQPADAQLVTGMKRDIALLARVPAAEGDEVTVLDVSLDRNREALQALLARGARVRWFDHHHSGDIPSHPLLEATIDVRGGACTSELVDRYLGGAHRAWAAVGAFGDNMDEAARRLAATLPLGGPQVELLRGLGECLNYNAYGASEADLVIAPAALYRLAAVYPDPLDFAREPVIARLAAARREDLSAARTVPALHSSEGSQVHRLPDKAWSRRVLGAFANLLAREDAGRAHLVLAPLANDAFVASIRAPAGALPAAQFTLRYGGGGGRAEAAGVDRLEARELDGLVRAFEQAYG